MGFQLVALNEGCFLSPRSHLAMSGYFFSDPNYGREDYWYLMGRGKDAAKHSIGHG